MSTPAQNPLEDFVDALESQGVASALQVLNARVAHRYTAVYELDGNLLRNLFLYDKAGEVRPQYLAEVDMGMSFCQFVLRDGTFLTDNSAFDSRLDGHPYKGVMVAYHGVPMTGPGGDLVGTLCHFDVEPRGLTSLEFECLQQAAQLLPAHLFGGPAAARLLPHH